MKAFARQTAAATEDIRSKIRAIQVDAQESVVRTHEINGVIEKLHALETSIAVSVEEQSAATNEISRSPADADAADGAGRIAETVTGISRDAHDTAELANHSKEVSLELARMAHELKGLAGRFRVREALVAPRQETARAGDLRVCSALPRCRRRTRGGRLCCADSSFVPGLAPRPRVDSISG